MDYRLRQQWLCRSDDKGPIPFTRTAFVLFENRIVGNVTWIRVRKLRIQSPEPGVLCGVYHLPVPSRRRPPHCVHAPSFPHTHPFSTISYTLSTTSMSSIHSY